MKSKLRAKVFIDGSNIYYAQKKMGKWLDWTKVKRFLTGTYEILEIRYYVGLRPQDKKVKKFLDKLRLLDFRLVTKPVKTLLDEQGHYLEKANFDVEITADILQDLKNLDIVLLFSGDSDFVYLAKLVKKSGKNFFVFSSRQTIGWELKRTANRYFLLERIKNLTKNKNFVRM